MLKIKVGDKSGDATQDESFEITQKENQWLIGTDIFDGDIVKLNDSLFHVLWQNRSFTVEVEESNIADKTFKLLINGQPYETSAKDQFDLLLEGLGMQATATKKINNLKAPMPGLIQSVAVTPGQEVEKGDTLLVLVAMKMENIIKSAGSGIVKTVKVTPGEIVEKNQVLIEFQ
ncbi:acetyl-CoA carboxylase biotin carboxyl carrier protein subunit [Dyadobacter sp. LHD-138]|uniref:acetyl-CoA carboxylase biotin carboxyl carrier protein subunit n=1 Tax=Dyadobacter sp. LHD-138 TaxID=3071413 RepID=UPI0027E09866|nr:acetyl-CoA carboxylase biotin carboxyl carrier protein subunit [Dyadobacter sp. LHD-138]MDQ6479522.1 acetyl-CoA carboxylase biotin carboxyl carrier protein subunit [Dyadobacter sp. LHD-138]